MERYRVMKLWPLYCMLAVLALLGCPQVGSAAGTWSVISFPVQPGDVRSPTAVAADSAGNLYVADESNGGRIQKRDAQGSWSVLAIQGTAVGQITFPWGL